MDYGHFSSQTAMAASSFHIREARRSDIPALVQVTIDAYRGRPLMEAFFPPHLKSSPGDKEEKVFREAQYERGLKKGNRHYPVVVNEADEVLGFACWHNAPDPPEPEKTREERKAELPQNLDFDVSENVDMNIKKLQENVKAALGEEEFKRAWCKDSFVSFPFKQVSPAFSGSLSSLQLLAAACNTKKSANARSKILIRSPWTQLISAKALLDCSCSGERNVLPRSTRASILWPALLAQNCTAPLGTSKLAKWT